MKAFNLNVMFDNRMRNGACQVFNLNLMLTAVTLCLSITNIADSSTKKRNFIYVRVRAYNNDNE